MYYVYINNFIQKQGAYDTELTGFSVGSVKLVFPQSLISLVQEIKDQLLAKASFRVVSCQYFNLMQSPWNALLPDKYLIGRQQKQLLQDLLDRVC